MNSASNVDTHFHWTPEQIADVQAGAQVIYLGMPATIEAVLADGVGDKGRRYKVVKARYGDSSTVTTSMAVGERIGFLRPCH